MKTVRFELLEPLCDIMDPWDVATMAFEQADKTCLHLRQELGIEITPPEFVLLKRIRFSREAVEKHKKKVKKVANAEKK